MTLAVPARRRHPAVHLAAFNMAVALMQAAREMFATNNDIVEQFVESGEYEATEYISLLIERGLLSAFPSVTDTFYMLHFTYMSNDCFKRSCGCSGHTIHGPFADCTSATIFGMACKALFEEQNERQDNTLSAYDAVGPFALASVSEANLPFQFR